MKENRSITKFDLFNYYLLSNCNKAQVKVGEFIFESHNVLQISLNSELIVWGEHHNEVNILKSVP
jgi:vomeronasal 2 receptor